MNAPLIIKACAQNITWCPAGLLSLELEPHAQTCHECGTREQAVYGERYPRLETIGRSSTSNGHIRLHAAPIVETCKSTRQVTSSNTMQHLWSFSFATTPSSSLADLASSEWLLWLVYRHKMDG